MLAEAGLNPGGGDPGGRPARPVNKSRAQAEA